MAWSTVFIDNVDPLVFDPNLDQNLYNTKNNSITPVIELEQLIGAVIERIKNEGRRINPNYNVDLATVRQSIPSNWNALTYKQKFDATINYGRQQLTTLRNNSVETADFAGFYRRYFFKEPTAQELRNYQNQYNNQDYGFGTQTQSNLKQSALNRAISSGLVPEQTTVDQFDAFVDPQNKDAFTARVLQLNGSGSRAIIDQSVIQQNPYQAAHIFGQLKTQGKLIQNSTGTYEWADGNSWRSLKNIDNGSLLNDYQKLLVEYEQSSEYKDGKTLSQYIALKNRAAYEQLATEVQQSRQPIDADQETVDQAKNLIKNTIKNQLDQNVDDINISDLATATKIAALKKDVFQQARSKLETQKMYEETNLNSVFNSLNSMYQDMASDLGVKPEFFKLNQFQSNINYNWQNWFENELRERYDPNNPRNIIKTVVGNSEEDTKLAVSFVQNYLQRRFDASKSLSEFIDYVNPLEGNPVLESSKETAWQKYTQDSLNTLTGSIDDPKSVLGNFWTNLQAAWARGREFNSEIYLQQPLVQTDVKSLRVSDLQQNLRKINDVALSKETTSLAPKDLKDVNLVGVDSNNDEELKRQIELYQQWFNVAYSNGVDLTDADQFSRLHYATYVKGPDNPILQLESGRDLNINNQELITSEEVRKILDQVQGLSLQAAEYAKQIQFGTFKTPEEYIFDMVKNSDSYQTKTVGDVDISELMTDVISEFSGVISTYAGEIIRQQIRAVLNENKKPDQDQLGVNYIQRTKDQALSTIKNLIRQDLYKNAVVIDNAPGLGIGSTLKDWFSNLGLELVPGSTWDAFKRDNNITSSTDFKTWENQQGKEIDVSTNKTKSQLFWEQWAKDNEVQIVSTGTPTEPRVSLVVQDPTPAWLAWAKRISTDAASNTEIQTKLNGAAVKVKADNFNSEWYSRTNPFTKVRDDWNSIVSNPNRTIVNLSGKTLGDWAKESGLSPDQAWEAYRTERQKTDRRFGKDPSGDDLSYISWSQNASTTEISRFWKESAPFWFNYLSGLGVIKGGDQQKPVFKTWNEWAIENNLELNRVTSSSEQKPPTAFMQLHYSTMGGKNKVDQEYLELYFPEFTQLEQAATGGLNALKDSPFDLTDFGFGEPISNDLFNEITPVTSTGRKSISPIDFAMGKMFGDSFSSDMSDPFAGLGFSETSQSNELGINFDTSYNVDIQSKKKITGTTGSDFGFGDFGGSSFGF